MALLYGENCMILASTVFDWSTRVTDGRTDRQTDGRTDGRTDGIAVAYTVLSIASRGKNQPKKEIYGAQYITLKQQMLLV